MKKQLVPTLCLIAALLAAGCSTEDRAVQRPDESAFPAHSLSKLEIKLDETPDLGEAAETAAKRIGSRAPIKGLTALQNQLWNQITNDQLRMNTLIEAFIEVHQADYIASQSLSEQAQAELPAPAELRSQIASLAN